MKQKLKPRKTARTAGEIFLELEELIDELVDGQGFQWGDVLNWVHGHLVIHRPDAVEIYEDGGTPDFYYGPVEE